MPRGVTIRPAVLADLPDLGRMGARLVALHHGWDRRRFFPVPDAEQGYRRYLGGHLDDPEVVILVAERGRPRRVCGYAYASLEPMSFSDLREACGKIHDLWVDDDARAGGTGGALLEETCRRLAALGVPRVVLMAASANPGAQALFARHRFRPTMVEMTRECGARARRTR